MDAACRKCRKFGEKLFLKGERCLSAKCAITRNSNAPGVAVNKPGKNVRRPKKSEYGLQLAEKQKAKSEYAMRERQFRGFFQKSSKVAEATGEALLQRLEARLDNVVYRLGWSKSRLGARQLVNHGHIKVNDKIVDIPSFQVKPGDGLSPIKPEILDKDAAKITPPKWLKLDKKSFKAEVVNLPKREEIDTPIDEQLIVEYYSR